MKALVLVARGLQVGALGGYGNPWIDTPALDGLAAEGIVFDRHFADTTDPIGARRAWRTGRFQFPGTAANETPNADLLAVLRARGIHTCLIVDDSRPSPLAFAEGWDAVQHIVATEDTSPLDATLEAVGAALERLEKRDDWLLWIDLATPLPPWDVPEEFQSPYFTEESDDEDVEEDDADDDENEEDDEEEDEESEELEALTPLTGVAVGPIDPDDDSLFLRLHTSYAAAVTYLDAGIGQLLDALANLEGGDDLLLLFTTDTGTNLGEHGIVGPVRAWLHDEVVHLPLIARLPGGAEAGRRVEALTQTVDLAATLADWFRTPFPTAHGRSLLPLIHGEVENLRPFACSGLQVGEYIEYALRTPDWAFILPLRRDADDEARLPRLYVKPDDRWEVNDVSQHHPELVERLERTLLDFVNANVASDPV